MRADASRNRDRILVAATRLFAERGFDVPLVVIAAEAGIGRTTLHRNFPTREDIVFALFDRSVALFRKVARPGAGPPASFEELFALLLHYFVHNGGIAEALQPEKLRSPQLLRQRREIEEALAPAARRGAAAGRLRADLGSEDMGIIHQMMVGALLTGGSIDDRQRKAERLRSLLFDGLLAREP